ncbi:MAG: YlxR family protein [Clostridia bacterium]|nr:YlxR family protein [Clostridia bacterium]
MEQTSRKKIPERRCTGCGERFPKQQLTRVVRSPEGEISLDATGKKPGRGAYLCKNPACLKKARKSRRLEQNLAVQIPDDIYDMLEGELTGEG